MFLYGVQQVIEMFLDVMSAVLQCFNVSACVSAGYWNVSRCDEHCALIAYVWVSAGYWNVCRCDEHCALMFLYGVQQVIGMYLDVMSTVLKKGKSIF